MTQRIYLQINSKSWPRVPLGNWIAGITVAQIRNQSSRYRDNKYGSGIEMTITRLHTSNREMHVTFLHTLILLCRLFVEIMTLTDCSQSHLPKKWLCIDIMIYWRYIHRLKSVSCAKGMPAHSLPPPPLPPPPSSVEENVRSEVKRFLGVSFVFKIQKNV